MSDVYTKSAERRLLSLSDDGEKNDYNSWAVKAKNKLDELDYWKYIEGPDSIPPSIPALRTTTKSRLGNELAIKKAEEAAKPWRKGDKTAKSLIVQATPNHKVHIISNCQTAKEAWEALRLEYAAPNRLKAVTLAQTIMSFKCDAESMDVKGWTERIRSLYIELIDLDNRAMTDRAFATYLSTLLPNSPPWRSFNRDLREKIAQAEDNGKPLTSTEVIALIREEAFIQDIDEGQFVAQLCEIETIRKKRPAAIANMANVPSSPTKKSRNDKKSGKHCSNKLCKNPVGHTIEDCLSYGGGKAGQYPQWWRGPTDIHLPPDQRKKAPTGQRQLNYGTDYPSTNNASAASTDTRANASFIEDAPPDLDADVTSSLAQGSFFALNTCVDPDKSVFCHNDALFTEANPTARMDNTCYHDSGANRHIFFDRAVFDNYREIPNLQVKGFGSTLSTAAIGVGDIFFTASCGGKNTELRLSNVLHVPSARLNLISQGCLERRNISCHFENGMVTLSLRGAGIVDGRILPNNLYRLNMTPITRNLADRLSTAEPTFDEGASANSAITPKSQDFYTAY